MTELKRLKSEYADAVLSEATAYGRWIEPTCLAESTAWEDAHCVTLAAAHEISGWLLSMRR